MSVCVYVCVSMSVCVRVWGGGEIGQQTKLGLQKLSTLDARTATVEYEKAVVFASFFFFLFSGPYH